MNWINSRGWCSSTLRTKLIGMTTCADCERICSNGPKPPRSASFIGTSCSSIFKPWPNLVDCLRTTPSATCPGVVSAAARGWWSTGVQRAPRHVEACRRKRHCRRCVNACSADSPMPVFTHNGWMPLQSMPGCCAGSILHLTGWARTQKHNSASIDWPIYQRTQRLLNWSWPAVPTSPSVCSSASRARTHNTACGGSMINRTGLSPSIVYGVRRASAT